MEPGEADDVALLQRIEDQSGHWLVFHRGGGGDEVRLIQTSGGQQLRLSYLNARGRLTDIALVHERKQHSLVQYGYDEQGQLSSVSDAAGQVTRRFEYTRGQPGVPDGLMSAHKNALGLVCHYQWQPGDKCPVHTVDTPFHRPFGPIF
jgi:YD repeat-containing protein